MKHIKDITISIFAIIGFAFVLLSFIPNETIETQEPQNEHIWGVSDVTDEGAIYLYRKTSGQIYYVNKIGKRQIQ